MMRLFYSLRSIALLTARRLYAQKGLTLATLLGLTIATTLIMTVPLYADAVNFRILQEQLSNQTERNSRPPFAYLYNYIGAWHEPVEWDAIQPVTDYLRDEGADELGLSADTFVWHVETSDYALLNANGRIGAARFATTKDLEDHINMVDGFWPTQASLRQDDPFGVALLASYAESIDAQVGDQFVMQNRTIDSEQFSVEVVGLWEPADADAAYWFYAPNSFEQILTVPTATYSGRIAQQLADEVYLGVWYWVLDGSRVGTADVDRLVDGAATVEQELETLLPNTQSLQSPVEALVAYQRAVSVLTNQLLGFNAPTLGLVVAFIGLVVSLAIQQRRNELAVLRSRGGTTGQIVGIAAVEGFLLGLLSFGLGILLSMWLTGQMGRVRSFLDFSAETQLRTIPNQATILAGLIAISFGILAQILPTLAVSGDTIVTYKRNQARARAPWWQRTFLDVFLFAIAAYGFYQLQSDDSWLAQQGVSVLENPVLLVLPTVAILAVTLFFLRLLPLVMRLLSWLLARTNSITLLQAVRYLARSTGLYATPLVLLTLTVSLSVFTASLARTFDLQLFDQLFYRVGADMNVLTTPDISAQSRFMTSPSEISTDFYLPPATYEEIDGVEKATRVGRFPANIIVNEQRTSVEFVGIERLDFAEVAYWRDDFSAYRFTSLMNALGRQPTSIIVPTRLLEEQKLSVGDEIPLAVSVVGGRVEFSAEIAASFDYFPTWYPETDDLIVVGNLSTIFEQIGGEVPYRVWLATTADFDESVFDTSLRQQDAGISLWREPRTTIEQTLVQPQRQGVFGLLSVGFIASGFLTVVGFFLYAVFSFRRRMVELGVLRAIGLSSGGMMAFIAIELGMLILSGLVLGTLSGIWISQQFIPLLQTGTRQADFVPPYLVEISWPAISQIYVLFGLVFLAAFIALSLLLKRLKLFEAIKLGETV